MAETALAVVTQDAMAVSSPLDQAPATFKAALDRRGENRKTLLEWVRGNLVEGTDFGYIHVAGKSKCILASQGKANECKDPSHWSPKPSLWKPGAEKICGMLEVIPTYPTLPKFEEAVLNGVEIKSIILKCDIVSLNGTVLSTGVGARSLAQDYGDLNKSLKMAKKSAHIDATLGFGGLSEVFTLDLEDMGGDVKTTTTQEKAPEKQPKADPNAPIGTERAKRLESAILNTGAAPDHLKNAIPVHCNGKHMLDELTAAEGAKLLAHFKEKAAQKGKPANDSEQVAFDAAHSLELDLSDDATDLGDLFDALHKHSTFDGDTVYVERWAGCKTRDEGKAVLRQMRDLLIGKPV